jgi:hypothetical protein
MSEHGPLGKIFGSPGFSLISAIADVSAVVIIGINDSTLEWVRDNPYLFGLTTAILLLLTVVLINSLIVGKRRTSEQIKLLEQELERVKAADEAEINSARPPEPAAQDLARFTNFNTVFGLESPLYQWLKNSYYVTRAKRQQLTDLSGFVRWYSDDPTTYHDPGTATAFEELMQATDAFANATAAWYFSPRNKDHPTDWDNLQIPPEWEETAELRARRRRAIEELETSHADVMDRHAKFVAVAHRARLTSV